MPNLGPMELAILLVIVLFIFGPKRLPGIGRSLGSTMREFRRSTTGDHKDAVAWEQAKLPQPRGADTDAAPADVVAKPQT